MILKISFIIALITMTLGDNDPSSDTLQIIGLLDTLNEANFLDGPSSISNAPTTPTINAKPSLKQMMYYNYYAAAMYCQYELNDLSCEYCEKFKDDVYDHTVLMNNITDCTALVALSKTRKEIVVVFRGTMNLWNVILDITTLAVTYPNIPGGIKLHAGFYIAAMSLYKAVVKNVGCLHKIYPSYKIVIVGHSLGAAMARVTQFFLLALNQFSGAKYECYTYGEPRSGNRAYVDYMNKRGITTARVVSSGDIVAHVPPTSLLGTTLLGDYFHHCQTEYWINDEDEDFCDQNYYEDPNCSDSLGPAYSSLDHGYYFDANYATCVLGQPAPWLAIPIILQPVGTIPPLPDKIYEFLSALINFPVIRLDQLLGG